MALSEKYWRFLLIFLLTLWVTAHLPGLFYGTDRVPLHISYIGDEQSPINGALHILKDKSFLALRDLPTVYYGPLFSIIALPAVIADFSVKYIAGIVSNTNDYRNFIIWDWGGIIVYSRLIAVVVGYLGLWGFSRFLSTHLVNPSGNKILPWLGTIFLAGNFFYFEYSGFFKHWVFLIAILAWQLYALVRIMEKPDERGPWILMGVLTILGFGISYIAILFQVMLLPTVFAFISQKNKEALRCLFWYVAVVSIAAALIVFWHPHAFLRSFGLTQAYLTGGETGAFTSETKATGTSFLYYFSIILNNELGLALAWIFLLFISFVRLGRIRDHLTWGLVLLVMTSVVFFGYIAHHESRYALPLIFFLIAGTFAMFLREYGLILSQPIFRIAISTALLFTFTFNVIAIGKWTSIISKGPPEKQAIAEMIDWQKNNPDKKTIVLAYYLFGHVHTKETYADYAKRFGKEKYNLYQAIMTTPLPAGVTALNAYYHRPDEPFNRGELNKYARLVYRYEPKLVENLDHDFMEVDLTRLWFYKDFSDKYSFLKQ